MFNSQPLKNQNFENTTYIFDLHDNFYSRQQSYSGICKNS